MKQKILSTVLVLMMLLSLVPVYGEEMNVTVYLSVSRYGEIVESAEEEPVAYVPVSLSGKESYNLDDCLKAAHDSYYPGDEAGYASSIGDWGLSIDMLWGDTSYNFGYQINGGTETVMGLDHPVEDGDYIDACIYQNLYPDTEGYARFDSQKAELVSGQELTLNLTYASGYDESWNTIYSPCEGATVFVNGAETEQTTDEEGQITLSFDRAGTYIISAQKTKLLKEETVPAITAPVCLVTVTEKPETELIHGIAGMYTNSDLSASGGNLPWILADMAVYAELFPESEHILSEEARETALSLMVEMAEKAEKPGDLAKTILGLRALGYDAGRIYTESYERVNLVEKLVALAESGDATVTNVYTLPYVLIALSQTAPETAESLIPAVLESKEAWQDTSYGTDAVTPMISALAPFAENYPEVKTVIEESVEIIKGEQREDGLIDGFEGYEAASTGLAVWALAGAGLDASAVFCGENSLIDGLLSVANAEKNGFPNAFATEQGFRGLLAWHLLTEETGRMMYDFSGYPAEEINLTGADFCPVQFDVSPSDASISIEGEPIGKNLYDLLAGEYTYEISASGYRDKSGSFTVSEEEAGHHVLKTVSVSLRREAIGGGSGGSSGGLSGGGFIPVVPNQKPEQGSEKPNVSTVFADVAENAWYCDAVQYVYDNGLFGGTDRGFEPDNSMTRAMLVTVLYRLDKGNTVPAKMPFSDVADNAWYKEGVAWAAEKGIVSGVTESTFAPDDNITREQLAVILHRYALYRGFGAVAEEPLTFQDRDSISACAKEAISFAVSGGIIGGKGNNMLCPKETASRAEVSMMLMRFMEVVNS